MSLPSIPNITPLIDIDREEALTMLMASIALEEMGLAHIINAEGEKIQYILNSETHKSASLLEIKEINQGVERVIRGVTKLQMLLQEKLESIISLTPKAPDYPVHPCPQPPKGKCSPSCTLTGSGKGCVSNKSDLFYGGVACVESSICPTSCDDLISLSLKYTLSKEKGNQRISAIFLAIPETIEVHCPNKLRPYSIIKEPNVITMRGQGIMAIESVERKLAQCSVTFTLTVWDYGCNKKFHMIICSSNAEFNHDSGVVSVTAGNLDIKSIPGKKLNE